MPLQMVEFYLILAAVRKVSLNIFWRILAGSLVMVVSGFLGELNYINSLLGFAIAVAGWIYVLYEIYSGEAGEMVAKSGNKSLVTAYSAMRIIVTIGWAIYPLGYVFSYLTGSGSLDSNSLNVIYNLADFINKIAFGLIIYACAVFNTTSRIR
jgi:bacteriorhodopsin